MSQYIVTEPSAKIRRIARQELGGKWPQVIIAYVIMYIFNDLIAGILDIIFPFYREIDTLVGTTDYNEGLVGRIYLFAVVGAFSYGLSLFLLTFVRTRQADNALMFEGFSRFGKVFILSLIIAIKVILWSLLFIIPGIIAGIRYSMAYYVLADNPDYSPTQCIEESKRLMIGNKMKYFCLYLSFIGWYILASIPTGASFVRSQSTITGLLIYSVLLFPVFAVHAYRGVSMTVLYEMIKRNIVVSDRPVYAGFEHANPPYNNGENYNQGSMDDSYRSSTGSETIKINYKKSTPSSSVEQRIERTEDNFGAPVDEKDDI